LSYLRKIGGRALDIPNDTGHPFRLNKFVEYQHKARSVAPPLLATFADRIGLSEDDIIMLCWYHSLTYCEITAIYMSIELPYSGINKREVREFWEEEKPNLIFGSARKYAKNLDWFIPLMAQFMSDIKREPYDWLVRIAGKGSPETKYNNIYKYLSKWKFMGRFSIERFLEILVFMSEKGLIPIKVRSKEVDWKHGSNLTSGILNIYYKDKEAEKFNKTGQISPEDAKFVAEKADEIFETVLKKYPNQESKDFIVIISKICSFRNLFKGARYGGYHHDRQLEQLLHYKKAYPKNRLWNLLFSLRKKCYPAALLGEFGGWTGIRKERKKLWLTEGLLGVEEV
jgi:hypothetical protein